MPILFHRMTEHEVDDCLSYLAEFPEGDRRKIAVAKLSIALKMNRETMDFQKLPHDHPARVDPDYPPNAWLEESLASKS